MGVAIMQQDAYIKQCIDKHLGNQQVYQNITDNYHEKVQDLNAKFHNFTCNIYSDNITRFRATAKVHKTPVKLRPIVPKVGTSIESVSKWLDHQLQKLMRTSRDSDTLRREVIEIQILPNAKLVTFDSQSMYSNICLDHAMQGRKHWLEQSYRAPITRPLNRAILQGLELVMRHNIMKFGDSYFLQLIGTEMGTSVAVVFANLYFGWHEKKLYSPNTVTPSKESSSM
eukprot:CCRYP_003568-RA/>CCRYP_003568-RA protein AED:0.17 eAED:0.17 QI:0/0/0/1/0/0/3/0/226